MLQKLQFWYACITSGINPRRIKADNVEELEALRRSYIPDLEQVLLTEAREDAQTSGVSTPYTGKPAYRLLGRERCTTYGTEYLNVAGSERLEIIVKRPLSFPETFSVQDIHHRDLRNILAVFAKQCNQIN